MACDEIQHYFCMRLIFTFTPFLACLFGLYGHLITDMNLSFSRLQIATGQTVFGFLKTHMPRDHGESWFFGGREQPKRELQILFFFFFAVNVTILGNVPTTHIAVVKQRLRAIIHQGIFKNKRHHSVFKVKIMSAEGLMGFGKFGNLRLFSHGRWSPSSRDLGACSSSMFSTRHPIPFLPLSPCVSASPCLGEAGINTTLPPPPTHPRLPARLQRKAPFAGLRSINRASTAPSNWFVISKPPAPPTPLLFLW